MDIKKGRIQSLFQYNKSKIAPLLGLVLLVVFFAITSKGKLLEASSIENIYNQGFPLLITSLAFVYVMATGNLDFSIGANVGFCATIACYVAFFNTKLAFPAALLTGALVGLINSLMYVFLKIPSFIACLCMMFILTAANQTLTGGGSKMVPVELLQNDYSIVRLVLLLIYIIIIVIIFHKTKVGKQLEALGISVEASIQTGVNAKLLFIVSYVVTGVAAGLAGYLMLLRVGAASPTLGSSLTIDSIIALVLGGMSILGGASSSMICAVTGSLITTVLNSGIVLAGMGGDAQQLIKGALFIIVVSISTLRESSSKNF
ncbi:MAG: ABC transporter permease [Clostridiaceae bacterium]|nr:ABC transporter permease [Clostridiaceae bacterium]